METDINASIRWDDLQMFLLLARNGSASRAAEQLGVSHTTIGRRIKVLENTLRARLVERSTGTSLQLTAEGATVAAEARKMEELALDLKNKLGNVDESISGIVRITITEGLAAYWLAGALQPWIVAHPELRVDWLTTNISRHDLFREADVGVWWFQPEDPHVVRRLLGTIGYSLFTTPSYVEEFGMPHSLEELGKHRILHFLGYDSHPGFRSWSALMRKYPPAMTLESTTTAEPVLRQGRYIALLPNYAARVVPEFVKVPIEMQLAMDVWVAYHEDRRNQARVRAVVAEISRLAQEAKGTWFNDAN